MISVSNAFKTDCESNKISYREYIIITGTQTQIDIQGEMYQTAYKDTHFVGTFNLGYVKFKTEGYYRINGNSGYHSSFGLPSSMKFNYGALIARIGSGELFALPSKDFIYFSKFEGPLYLKINFPKNI